MSESTKKSITDADTNLKDASARAPFTGEQFQRLVEVISRSQNNYRELIDSLDQAVFTLSLEGEIRVANRRFAEVFNANFLPI